MPLQPRRTLDQYFYSHLDNTAHRDKDQVVYRYTESEDPKIFMVDQMWMWIINGGLYNTGPRHLHTPTDTVSPDTLITCIPTRWRDGHWSPLTGLIVDMAEENLVRGPSIEHQVPPRLFHEPFMTPPHEGLDLAAEVERPNTETINIEPIYGDNTPSGSLNSRISPPPASTRKARVNPNNSDNPMNIQHKVLQHLKETSRKAIESIHDLAGLIATCCASLFDENQIPEEMQFLDFFERSIGIVFRITITGKLKNLYH